MYAAGEESVGYQRVPYEITWAPINTRGAMARRFVHPAGILCLRDVQDGGREMSQPITKLKSRAAEAHWKIWILDLPYQCMAHFAIEASAG